MKMLKKKTVISLVALVAASILAASGCGNDDVSPGDGDGDGTGGSVTDGDGDSDGDVDLSTCEGLCDATADEDCETKSTCLAVCGLLELQCEDRMNDYLECGADKNSVVCVDDVPFGLVPGCEAAGQVLLACFGGMGGAGGGGGAGGAGGATP